MGDLKKGGSQPLDQYLERLDSMPVLTRRAAETADMAESLSAPVIEPCGETAERRGRDVISTMRPLHQLEEETPYPVEELGDVLGDAAKAMSDIIQVPLPMACQSVLATAALVCQPHANVSYGAIEKRPISLFLMTIAESGDRKSAVDKAALKPVLEYERRKGHDLVDSTNQHKVAMKIWEKDEQILNKALDKELSSKNCTPLKRQELEAELEQLEMKRPQKPLSHNLLLQEPTVEGIWKHFTVSIPTAGLFSDEGLGFFSGHGMAEKDAKGRMITTLSNLWDGSDIKRTRTDCSDSMTDRRVSSHLMMQPVVANEVLNDSMMREQGFLPRFLVCKIKSMAGDRLLTPQQLKRTLQSDLAITTYQERITQLLNCCLPLDEVSAGLEPKDMTITGVALDEWMALYNDIEKQLGKNGSYNCIKAFGSKAPEQIARIAAVLSVFEESEITDCHVRRAGQIVSYYLDSMVFNLKEASEDMEWKDASDLLAVIQSRGGSLHCNDFKKLPLRFRSANKARKQLALLVDESYLLVCTWTRGKPSSWEIPIGVVFQ